LRTKIRNNGVLSFRLITHVSRRDLEADHEYPQTELLISPVRPLTAPKVLRDRGIKVITAGFGDLTPVSEAVSKQRLDNWRATWATETTIAQAGYELEAMRIRSRARALAQQELAHSFAAIFQRGEHSNEILALRIFQALEKIASDPQTKKLLPGETINLLDKVRTWLKPGG
jgi:hypothetical protein